MTYHQLPRITTSIDNQLADNPDTDTVYVRDIFSGEDLPTWIEYQDRSWRLCLRESSNDDNGTAVYKTDTLFDGVKI